MSCIWHRQTYMPHFLSLVLETVRIETFRLFQPITSTNRNLVYPFVYASTGLGMGKALKGRGGEEVNAARRGGSCSDSHLICLPMKAILCWLCCNFKLKEKCNYVPRLADTLVAKGKGNSSCHTVSLPSPLTLVARILFHSYLYALPKFVAFSRKATSLLPCAACRLTSILPCRPPSRPLPVNVFQ